MDEKSRTVGSVDRTTVLLLQVWRIELQQVSGKWRFNRRIRTTIRIFPRCLTKRAAEGHDQDIPITEVLRRPSVFTGGAGNYGTGSEANGAGSYGVSESPFKTNFEARYRQPKKEDADQCPPSPALPPRPSSCYRCGMVVENEPATLLTVIIDHPPFSPPLQSSSSSFNLFPSYSDNGASTMNVRGNPFFENNLVESVAETRAT